MALKFIRKKQKKSDGSYDIVHYETSAKVVWTEEGISVEEALQNVGCDGVSATLSASSWAEQSNGCFSQTVNVSGVTASNQVVVDCALSGSDIDADIAMLDGWGCVNRASQASGSLTFYCYRDKPTVNILINVVVM